MFDEEERVKNLNFKDQLKKFRDALASVDKSVEEVRAIVEKPEDVFNNITRNFSRDSSADLRKYIDELYNKFMESMIVISSFYVSQNGVPNNRDVVSMISDSASVKEFADNEVALNKLVEAMNEIMHEQVELIQDDNFSARSLIEDYKTQITDFDMRNNVDNVIEIVKLDMWHLESIIEGYDNVKAMLVDAYKLAGGNALKKPDEMI